MLGGETVRTQDLNNVCSTRHLYNLGDHDESAKKALKLIIETNPSLILIVSQHQYGIRKALVELSKKKTGIRARCCGKVTSTGTLWKISRFN